MRPAAKGPGAGEALLVMRGLLLPPFMLVGVERGACCVSRPALPKPPAP